MSNDSVSQPTSVFLMAEFANSSSFPANSDDTEWNWTFAVQTESSVGTLACSTGFQVSVVIVLSLLIVTGTLLNLVTVVTHLQTVSQKKTAADCITYIAGPLQSDAVVMRLETVYCNYCNRLQRSQNGPTKYRRSIAVVTDELLR